MTEPVIRTTTIPALTAETAVETTDLVIVETADGTRKATVAALFQAVTFPVWFAAPGGPYDDGEELVAIPAGIALSLVGAGYVRHGTQPDAATTLLLKRKPSGGSWATIATATWNGSAWSAALATTPTAIAATDELGVYAPATANAALTDAAWTLLAKRA